MSSLPSFFLPPNAFHPVRSRPVEGMVMAATGRSASHGVHDRAVTIRDAEIIRQMRKVLRVKPGDAFIALDGQQHEYTCRVDALDRDRVRATIMHETVSARETRVSITLYASLIRRERFALLLEKCTELGVSRFSPIAAVRSPFREITPHLQERWEHIIREAAEVARRGILPALLPVVSLEESLAAIPRDVCVIVLGTQQEHIKTAHAIPEIMRGKHATAVGGVPSVGGSIHLFVGPEGDYTDEEYALFADRGAVALSLGPRIVRSETAAIAAVAIVTALL